MDQFIGNKISKNSIYLENKYKNNLIIINGIWGSGKSMITPIIETIENVENFKIPEDFECILNALKLNKIDFDAANFIIHSYCKRILYNRMIGREINFRFKDDSGPKTIRIFFEYIKRLFKDDSTIFDNIESSNKTLLFMTHSLFVSQNDVFKIFNKNSIKFIEVVRHPAFLLKHWESYFNRWNSNKEFTFAYNYNNFKIPWFLTNKQNDFISLNDLEKSILCISELYNEIFNYIINKNKNENLLILSFEGIALHTNSTINNLEIFFNTKFNCNLKRVLHKQKLPREYLLNGLGKGKYGFKNVKLSDLSFINNTEIDVEKRTNYQIFNLYKETVIKYNKFFPINYK